MDTVITFTECYFDRVPFIVMVANQRHDSGVDQREIQMAKKMLTSGSLSRRKNQVAVKYRQKTYLIGRASVTAGRWFAKGASYQNMLGSFCRVIASGHLVEIDMENAHYNLVVGRWPDLSGIQDYVTNRESRLEELVEGCQVERWRAKELPIRIMYGGAVKAWLSDHDVEDSISVPPFVYRLQDDISEARRRFVLLAESKLYMKIANSKEKRNVKTMDESLHLRFKGWKRSTDPVSSAFSLWLQTLEAKCVMSAIDFGQEHGVLVHSVKHDGYLVDAKSRDIDTALLGAHVREATGERCFFSVKELELDDEDLSWKATVERGHVQSDTVMEDVAAVRDPMTIRLVECAKRVNHEEAARIIHNMFPDKFVYLGSKQGWYMFSAPRWFHLGDTNEPLYDVMREFSAKVWKRSIS